MTPTQLPLTASGSVAVGHNTAAIPNDSSNIVYFTHYSIKFVMDLEGKNEITKVKCNGGHLIDQVLQCMHHDAHLMCRKCCFPLDEDNPETCPEHMAPVFDDRSATRSICSMLVKCPANETFKVKCPWSGQYNEVTSHLDDCTFIPGSARVTMQNAMLKAADQGYGQKFEEYKQKITLEIRQMKRESDNRFRAMEKLFEERSRDLMQKYKQQADLLENLSLELVTQQMTSSAATTVEDEIPPCFNGKLLWPVKNFLAKRNLTGSGVGQRYLESPPFYTDEIGYKMRVRLYPSGDGCGKDEHLSLFFQIMKGPFDALLEWPFNKKITLKVLRFDGESDCDFSFKPDLQSCSFQRPQHRHNISTGNPTMISHKALDDGTYIKDGTLFIEVSVGP